jgi:hypothetical protein
MNRRNVRDGDWDELVAPLKQLAFINEAVNSYEVDQTGLYYDPETKEFAIVSATGCSCWNGEAYIERCKTFEEVETALRTKDLLPLYLSLHGADELITEARKVLSETE